MLMKLWLAKLLFVVVILIVVSSSRFSLMAEMKAGRSDLGPSITLPDGKIIEDTNGWFNENLFKPVEP